MLASTGETFEKIEYTVVRRQLKSVNTHERIVLGIYTASGREALMQDPHFRQDYLKWRMLL